MEFIVRNCHWSSQHSWTALLCSLDLIPLWDTVLAKFTYSGARCVLHHKFEKFDHSGDSEPFDGILHKSFYTFRNQYGLHCGKEL